MKISWDLGSGIEDGTTTPTTAWCSQQSSTVPDTPYFSGQAEKKRKRKKRGKKMSGRSGVRIISDICDSMWSLRFMQTYSAVRQSYFILWYGNNVSKYRGSDYRQGKTWVLAALGAQKGYLVGNLFGHQSWHIRFTTRKWIGNHIA